MSEKEGVELSQYGAGKKTVVDSLKYIRDHEKIKPWAKGLGLGVLVISVILIVCKPDPAPPAQETGNIPAPSVDGNQPSIDLSAYNRGDDVRRSEAAKRSGSVIPTKFSGPKLIQRSVKIKVPPGTEAKAILMTGASNGLVKVKLKEDVSVAGENYLAAGTMLIGQGSSTDDRLFVHFTKAVTSDATVSGIEAEIADGVDKTMGLKGSFWSTHGGRIAAGAGLNFIAGATEAMQDTHGEQGAVVAKPTVRNAVLNGTARAALEESNDIASKYKNAPPAVEIRAGTEVAIIFTDNGG
jgi:hypothetical protein